METVKSFLRMFGNQIKLNSVFLKVDFKKEWDFSLQIFSPFQTNLFLSTPVI